MLNTSVTLKISSILKTLPKAELPASVKLHMCTKPNLILMRSHVCLQPIILGQTRLHGQFFKE